MNPDGLTKAGGRVDGVGWGWMAVSELRESLQGLGWDQKLNILV